jgi:hypothetical protein
VVWSTYVVGVLEGLYTVVGNTLLADSWYIRQGCKCCNCCFLSYVIAVPWIEGVLPVGVTRSSVNQLFTSAVDRIDTTHSPALKYIVIAAK